MDTTASMSDMDEYGDTQQVAAALTRDAVPTPPVEKHVCPYCGLAGPRPDGPCARCTIEDSPATRQATKARIGPWYVLQSRNPAAPGMKWSTLLALVKKGQITARSVVRGPTTHQLWRLASQVKGLSREFNVCYSCGGQIDRTSNQCPHCDRLQEPPANPDQLLESREPLRKPEPLVEAAAGNDLALARVEPGRPDAGLLTARELAAAFQLEFAGESAGASLASPPARGNASRVAAEPSTVVEASLNKSPAEVIARPRRRAGRVLMVLSLLGMVGAAAVIWLNPEYQAKARDLVNAGVDTVSSQLQSSRSVETSEPHRSLPQTQQAESDRPTSREPTARRADKPPEPRISPSRDNPAPGNPSSAPEPIRIPSDPEEARQLVRSLRSVAIDAEAAGDFAKAVAQYEQIRKLPREFWPSDLDLRLSGVKQKLR